MLYTNTSLKGDTLYKRLNDLSIHRKIFIASAFFTYEDFILKSIDKGCSIDLIVRLNSGTSPRALREIISKPNVFVRYYTSVNFHPKLYIVENTCAIFGSSNLTKSGLLTNQEINTEVSFESDDYENLLELFRNYWTEADVLTPEKIALFEDIINKHPAPINPADNEIKKAFGDVNFSNVKRDETRSKKDLYFSSFEKSYQKYITSFNELKNLYSTVSDNIRWNDIPTRIELDRFLWWIREEKCPGDSFLRNNEATLEEKLSTTKSYKSEFVLYESPYLDSIAHNYKAICDEFSNAETISIMSEDKIFDALIKVHAFHDRLRFVLGGLPGLKKEFFKLNSLSEIKKSITHLLFNTDKYEKRVYDCVIGEFKLHGFGDSCVKELLGMMNTEDIPICNGRTLKSMEWLGYGKL